MQNSPVDKSEWRLDAHSAPEMSKFFDLHNHNSKTTSTHVQHVFKLCTSQSALINWEIKATVSKHIKG